MNDLMEHLENRVAVAGVIDRLLLMRPADQAEYLRRVNALIVSKGGQAIFEPEFIARIAREGLD